jgi:hypothetical protein
LAAPLVLLFPLVGMGDLLPVTGVPFFLSLFLFVLNSDINNNFKLVKLQNQKIPNLKSQDPKPDHKSQEPKPKQNTNLKLKIKNTTSQVSNI